MNIEQWYEKYFSLIGVRFYDIEHIALESNLEKWNGFHCKMDKKISSLKWIIALYQALRKKR